MIEKLSLINLSKPYFVPELNQGQFFILNTCQRTLILSLNSPENLLDASENINLNPSKDEHEISFKEQFNGIQAYQYLLETICGLKSKLLGESEVMGQFREAYKKYLECSNYNKNLQLILEKALQDAKNLKSHYLNNLAQKTYSNITRKILKNNQAKKVLIIGSGQLCIDLIGQLRKDTQIFICARNSQAVMKLHLESKAEIIPWEYLSETHGFSDIVNTVGTDEILFDQNFFQKWSNKHQQKCFIDLGEPSPIKTHLCKDEKVYRLKDIFFEGAEAMDKKKKQIQSALDQIKILAEHRKIHFQRKSHQKNLYINANEPALYGHNASF